MILLLDTNVFITFMREPFEFDRFGGLVETGIWTDVFMSSVSLFELEVGVVGRHGEALAHKRLSAILSGPIQVEAFDNRAASTGARIAAKARSSGKQLSSVDAMIAGHAAVLNAKLVTNDVKLAAALDGVEVLNWS